MNSWGVFHNLGPIESRGIRPSDVPQMRGQGTNMFVCSGYNLSIRLVRHGLIESSDGLGLRCNSLGNVEKGSPYVTIRQRRRIDRGLVIISIFFERRDFVSRSFEYSLPIIKIKGLDAKRTYSNSLETRY